MRLEEIQKVTLSRELAQATDESLENGLERVYDHGEQTYDYDAWCVTERAGMSAIMY